MTESRIEVGYVSATHGVAGKVKVVAYSGDPAALLALKRVLLARRGEAEDIGFEVRTAQRIGGCAVLALEGIDGIEAAEGWVGARVSVLRSWLPPPEDDEYYVADLVGCDLLDPSGNRLGRVTGVTPGPGHDWLEVRREGGGEALLPMVEAFIREVDTAGRVIRVSPPEGW